MKTTLMNPVKAFTLIALGLAIAVMGIYVADVDDAPGAAVIGMLLMVVGVVLGVRAACNPLPVWAARTAHAVGVVVAAFAAFLTHGVVVRRARAVRRMRAAAGLSHIRFHDGRHTALTRLAEKGVPDWVIRAQFGHVSPSMMAVYSHVRRKALDEAAKALEPDAVALPPAPEPVVEDAMEDSGVMSHVTSQPASIRRNVT